MITAYCHVLAMQFLEIFAVVRYHAVTLCHSIGKLFWVRLAQLTCISGSRHPESPRREQICNNNSHILVQVDACEQFAAQRCLTLGWMSSSGTRFLLMWSMISSE